MSLDELLDQVLTEPADGPLCPCSHRRDFHCHEPDGRHCIRACGCKSFRGIADEARDAATTEAARCTCPRFSDTGGFRIADLCCPVHGTAGTDPGDGYREEGA